MQVHNLASIWKERSVGNMMKVSLLSLSPVYYITVGQHSGPQSTELSEAVGLSSYFHGEQSPT